MSDFPGSRCEKNEEFQIFLTKNDPIEIPQHKNYLWMARWTKASSSNVEPPNDSSSNRLEDLGAGTNDGAIPNSEFMKSAVADRLILGVNHGSTSVQHSRRFSSNMRGLAHDFCNELGPKNYEHRDESFERRIKHKAVNLHAKVAVSETYSLRKLSELPLDLQKFGSLDSDIQSSDWNHFPMFEINRKIDNILNPKRRSALGSGSRNANLSSSHVMELSAQEYMVPSHQMRDENMDIHKPAGGISTHLEGLAGISSDHSGQKLKGHLSDTMSCSCSKDNNSSDCQIDEQHTSNYAADLKHEPPFVASGKALHFVGNEKNQIDASAFHNLKSRRSAAYKEQDAAEDIFRAPVLATEFRMEPTNCSYKSKQGSEDFDRTSNSHGKDISLLPYEQQRLKAQRTESPANLNLPDPDADTLTVTSKQLTHEKETTKKSTGSCKRKGPCLYEMLTTDPKSQSTCPKNSMSVGNGFDVCMYGTNIGSRLFGTQNQSSVRTETLYSDTLIVSKSSADIASSPAQKDCAYPNQAKNEPLATPPMRRDSDSRENGEESHNLNEHLDVFSKATIASKQSCIPATGTTNLDLMLFQMSRMRNPISVGVVQRPVSAEPSDRWLKRLHPDVLDPEIHSSKRQNDGGSPPHVDSRCLFGMALQYNRTVNEESIDCVKENKVPDEGIKLHDDQRLHVPANSMNYWVGRWCEGGTPVFHGDPGQQRQATKPDLGSEDLGGQFPSIAAMAMMGRAMNKLRPCEHQKKGPFVVWKTE